MCDKPRCVLKRLEKELEEYARIFYDEELRPEFQRMAADLSTVLEQSYVLLRETEGEEKRENASESA